MTHCASGQILYPDRMAAQENNWDTQLHMAGAIHFL